MKGQKNMSDSDGKSEIASTEPIMALIPASEPGKAGKTKTPRFPKMSGEELDCHGFALIIGGDHLKISILSEIGSFYVKITDSQMALINEDWARHIGDKIRKAAKKN
jgi:hypothetical protein